MDDEDLDLLRKCLPGDVLFHPESQSKEHREEFNPWGDRLLALRDRGLLDIPDGLIKRDHLPGAGKYSKIGVRRVTAAGRQELRRREPPDAATVQIIRTKIEHDIADRHRLFGAKHGELVSRLGHSSMAMQAVEALLDDEYRERGRLLVVGWRAVVAAQEILLTPRVAQMMNDDLWARSPALCSSSSLLYGVWARGARPHWRLDTRA